MKSKESSLKRKSEKNNELNVDSCWSLRMMKNYYEAHIQVRTYTK